MKFNTIEDMINYVIEPPIYEFKTNRRYELKVIRDSIWYLEEAKPDHLKHSIIYLDNKLAEEIFKIWKHTQINTDSSLLEPKGSKTLAGILKALGKSDISKQIKAVKAEEQRKFAIRRYNDDLRESKKYAVVLIGLLEKIENVEALTAKLYEHLAMQEKSE